MAKMLFTSESVTEGHPDKVCDGISDAILDEILKNDPDARVACETFCTTGSVTVMGEITTSCYVDIPQIARDVVCRIGYDSPSAGFDGNTCAVMTAIDKQSPDIALGVDNSLEYKDGEEDEYNLRGAGDQGMMFGYACDDTPELMPLPISLAHKMAKRLTDVRKSGELSYLRPDGKTQVTVEYDDGRPARIEAVVVSSQHSADIDLSKLRADILEKVIKPTVPAELLDENTKIYINPTGRFVVGGPQGDTGLTGRKIIVDTYGGFARHGGGAFSGKDPSKVDRTGAYMARYLAKNIVAAELADRCEIELAYAIGLADPVSVTVDMFGTGRVSDEKLARWLMERIDMRPGSITSRFELRRPIYRRVSCGGHFGENAAGLPWEWTDIAELLQKEILA